ncbi:MAG: cupin domain-containing protein [Serpentinimonas sp.]|jgi:hypothetical protein|nr:cupin domain-containing protein [Serpentinimonas sp.]
MTAPHSHPLTRFGLPESTLATPELSHPQPDRLLQGNPLRETWNCVESPVGGAQALYAGLWRCEPGHWRIAMGATEQEVFTVLAGRCRVHSDAGGFQEAAAGQSIYIPAGFTGSFEVLETVTKAYVILE